MSAAATQRTAILDLLREVGEDGAPVNSMVEAGGMWWKDRVVEINNWTGYNIGWEMVKGEKRYFLIVEPVSTEALPSGDQSGVYEAGLPGLVRDQAGGSASVDTQLTLLPSSVSPYDTEREAA